MNPILLDVPEQFKTERLVLRAPIFGDGVIVNAAIRESFKTLSEWMNWADHIPEIEETEENVRKNRASFLIRQGFFFCMLDKASERFIGTCGLLRID